jgi:nucleotide-binding universal stress UspA family protein
MKHFIVLAAVDFSPASASIAEHAFELATAHPRAEVHLVSVQELTLELLAPAHDELRLPDLHGLAERAVRGFEADHAISTIERVLVHTLIGDPANEIVTLAAEIDADLIVVGTHGRRGLPRAILGSVAEKVVRTAGCPVFVVRRKAHPDALRVPEIEPVCTECAGTRKASGGRELWCARHAERHQHAHVYAYSERGHGGERPWGFSLPDR